MPELQVSQRVETPGGHAQAEEPARSTPERELQDFVNRILRIAGQGAASDLTEMWLDEVARMDYLPSPNSPAWRLVSLAASARFASRFTAARPGDFDC